MSPVLQRELRHPRLWFAAGMLLAGAVAWASLLPASRLPGFGLWDKLEHALAYGMLAFWFGSVMFRRSLPVLFIALLLFGLLLEWAQGAMALGRQSDWHDLFANGVGALAGVLASLTPAGRWAHRVEALLCARGRK